MVQPNFQHHLSSIVFVCECYESTRRQTTMPTRTRTQRQTGNYLNQYLGSGKLKTDTFVENSERFFFMLTFRSPILRVLECGRVKRVSFTLLTVRSVIKGLQILLQYHITVVMMVLNIQFVVQQLRMSALPIWISTVMDPVTLQSNAA